MNLAHKTISNAIGSFAGFFTLTVTAFLITPYTLERLHSDQYGIFALFFSLIGLLSFLDFGFGYTSIRFIADAATVNDHRKIQTIINMNVMFFMIVGIILITLTLLFLQPIMQLLNIPSALQPATRISIIIVVLSLPTSLIMGVYGSVLQAYQKYIILNVGVVVSAITFTGLNALVLYYHPSLVILMILNFSNAASLLLVYWIITRRLLPSYRLRWEFDRTIFKDIFNFSWHTLVIIVAMRALFQFDKLFISSYYGSSAVTPYALPSSISTKLHGVISNINNVLFPLSTTLHGQREQAKLILLYQKSIKFTYLVLAAMVVPLVVYAPLIIGLWLGQQYVDPSAHLLQLGTIGMALFSCTTIPASFLAGFNNQKQSMYFIVTIALSNLVALAVLVPTVGLVGAAWALIIAHWVVPIMIVYVERKIGVAWQQQLKLYSKLLVVSGVSGLVMWFTLPYVQTLWILLFVLIGAGCAVLLLGYVVLFDPDDRLIIKSYLAKFIPQAQ